MSFVLAQEHINMKHDMGGALYWLKRSAIVEEKKNVKQVKSQSARSWFELPVVDDEGGSGVHQYATDLMIKVRVVQLFIKICFVCLFLCVLWL